MGKGGEGRGRGIYGRSGAQVFLQFGPALIYLTLVGFRSLSGRPERGVVADVAMYLPGLPLFFLGSGSLSRPRQD